MASITKRTGPRGTTFKAVIRRTGHPTVSRSFKTKRDALAFARRIEGDTETMRALGTSGRYTVADAVDAFIRGWDGKDPSTPTRAALWADWCGSIRLTDLTKARIKQALDAYEATGVQPATVNRCLRALSSVLTAAKEEPFELNTNVALGVPMRKEPRGRVRFLSDAERVALLDACKASSWERLHLFILLALTTGARRSELLGLRWKDLDIPSGVAMLHDTKNGEDRVLPLVGEALAELRALPRPLDGEVRVFPARSNPYAAKDIKWVFTAAVRAAGIENFRLHDCRHSCASYLAQAGLADNQIAHLLGHRSVQTTRRYSHLRPEDAQAAAEVVAAVIRKGALKP